MKKYILAATVCATLIIPAALGFSSPPRSVDAIAVREIYTVKEYRGKIGIFEAGKEEPSAVLDVFVFTLPERDRKMLKDGFSVSEEEIFGVIEDYTV